MTERDRALIDTARAAIQDVMEETSVGRRLVVMLRWIDEELGKAVA